MILSNKTFIFLFVAGGAYQNFMVFFINKSKEFHSQKGKSLIQVVYEYMKLCSKLLLEDFHWT